VADSRKQYYFITTDKQKASSKDVEELIQYALEFKINQKYDEETYSL
jgi:hypothetical protein